MSLDYYDNFANTPFDLNHDGHIDPIEAAYIRETFNIDDNYYGSSKYDGYTDTDFDDDDDDSDVCYVSPEKCKEIHDMVEEIKKSAEEEQQNKNRIALGIFFVACIVFASSPAIALFIGGIMLSAKISKIF